MGSKMTGRLQEEGILKFPGRFTWISAKAKDAKVWWARKLVNSGHNQKPGRLWRGGSPGSSPCPFPHLPLGGALALCATRPWSQAAAVGGPCWWCWEVCVWRMRWRVGSALRAALGFGATVGSPETPLDVSTSAPSGNPGVRYQQGSSESPSPG